MSASLAGRLGVVGIVLAVVSVLAASGFGALTSGESGDTFRVLVFVCVLLAVVLAGLGALALAWRARLRRQS